MKMTKLKRILDRTMSALSAKSENIPFNPRAHARIKQQLYTSTKFMIHGSEVVPQMLAMEVSVLADSGQQGVYFVPLRDFKLPPSGS